MQRKDGNEAEQAGRAVVPGGVVNVTGTTARLRVGRPAATPGGGGEPHVEVIREGEEIRAIEVTCTCGKKIRVYCTYQ